MQGYLRAISTESKHFTAAADKNADAGRRRRKCVTVIFHNFFHTSRLVSIHIAFYALLFFALATTFTAITCLCCCCCGFIISRFRQVGQIANSENKWPKMRSVLCIPKYFTQIAASLLGICMKLKNQKKSFQHRSEFLCTSSVVKCSELRKKGINIASCHIVCVGLPIRHSSSRGTNSNASQRQHTTNQLCLLMSYVV